MIRGVMSNSKNSKYNGKLKKHNSKKKILRGKIFFIL